MCFRKREKMNPCLIISKKGVSRSFFDSWVCRLGQPVNQADRLDHLEFQAFSAWA
jgi:hypothetical protein